MTLRTRSRYWCSSWGVLDELVEVIIRWELWDERWSEVWIVRWEMEWSVMGVDLIWLFDHASPNLWRDQEVRPRPEAHLGRVGFLGSHFESGAVRGYSPSTRLERDRQLLTEKEVFTVSYILKSKLKPLQLQTSNQRTNMPPFGFDRVSSLLSASSHSFFALTDLIGLNRQ